MIHSRTRFTLPWIVSITSIALFLSSASATTPPAPPYHTPWSISEGDRANYRRLRSLAEMPPTRDLDNYIGSFERVCAFLDIMQEHDEESRDYGGLHEGEGDGLWAIVETDNTQEAIRVWCEYALFFDDPDTYRSNIDAAWEYCYNYPAWDESRPEEMYAMHNSGWGLIAEMAFRSVFDDDTHREYGDSCAQHLVDNVPEIGVEMEDILMPLVAGWSAGTLYRYGIYEDNEDYTEAALRIGSDVQDWIDHDPDRLNANEIWALCGGTALWGVINSWGAEDSAQTAEWVNGIIDNMDVFAGGGQWNNSWNIWYAHAWVDAWKLTGEEEYVVNAIAIVDSLLDQDGDNDGGIPAGGGDGDDRDQAWVTAYMGWMGLRQLFDRLPEAAVAMDAISSPLPTRPWPVDSPLEFSFLASNHSLDDELTVRLNIIGDFEAFGEFPIRGWQPNLLTLEEQWTPDEVGQFEFTGIVSIEDDPNHDDDSLDFTLDILPVGEVIITSIALEPDTAVGCRVDFYNYNVMPSELFASFEISEDQRELSEILMVGTYRVKAIPEFPYARITLDSIEIGAEGVNLIDLEFYHPSILLIDDDIDTMNASYYQGALQNLGYSSYHWRTLERELFVGATDGFPTVIYFSGDRVEDILGPNLSNELVRHLRGGNSLFMTGQYISETMDGTDFFRDRIHCSNLRDDIGRSSATGVEDDEALDGLSMLFLGPRGANNQRSPSGIEPLQPAVSCAIYRGVEDTSAAIRWEEPNGARGVFFGFGFEGISGMGGTSTRDEVMTAVLEWLGVPLSIDNEYPSMRPPQKYSFSVSPNPSNGAVRIRLNRPLLGAAISIHDLQGRTVRTLPIDFASQVTWDVAAESGIRVPSAVYLVRLTGVGKEVGLTQKIVILR